MVSGFICGHSSLPHEEDEFDRQTRSAGSSPRRRHCCRSSKSNTSNKNPYSSRGLDTFSALLAEIEEKRQQIYSRIDPDEISLVRFVYSPDRHIKPIVVKSKTIHQNPKIDNPLPDQHHNANNNNNNGISKKLSSSSSMAAKREEKKIGFFGKLRVYQWNDPRFYLPVAIILILVSLVFFGRAFVIMCTSIGWYAIPVITNNDESNSSKSFKKKDFAVRRLSEKKLIRKEGTVSFKSSEAKSQHQNGPPHRTSA